ncbi:MAG: glycosyltransferase family 1 protein [Alphaproteobacteria bacterium]|nr:glycosyltransferase family 1 protein [Alphaproteobacteria bacterium]
MKKIFIYLFIFLLSIATGILLYKHQISKFFIISQNSELKFSVPIQNNAVTINSCVEEETSIGEVFLGKALKSALEEKYKDVSIDYRLNMYPENKNDEIHIYLRGYFKFLPPFPDDKHINIAYIIYPLFYTQYDKSMIKNRDKITMDTLKYGNIAVDELQFYDALAVASKPYTEKLKRKGFKAYYVPQFTNTDIFYRNPKDELKSEVLFVGTKRQYGSADMALKHNIPITIYGPAWGGVSKKEYINNEELHKYYSSAKIVLNDHREDMRTNGFINNRVYDVTATGTLLISDYMPEIEEAYGDSIPMYKTEEELIELINYYLTHDKERQDKAQRAQEITLKNFTQKNIGKYFYDIIEKQRK